MISTRRELLLTFAALAIRRLRAEEKQPTFSSDVRVVNSFVTVHDKKGKIITDLTKDDFEIWEDGRPQTIRYFSRQTDLPLRLGLIVDNTPSESNMTGVERSASSAFLDQVLRPDKDKAFVIRFGNDVELLQDLTNSREKLNRALDALDNPSNDSADTDPSNSNDPGGRPRYGRGGGGPNSTVLSDSIYLASNEVLQSETGRKALIVLGDGDHVGNRESEAVDAAQKSNCVVYAVRIYDKNFGGGGSRWHGLSVPGLGVPGMGGGPPVGGGPGMGGGRGGGPGGMPGRSDGKQNLQNLAGKTGGAAFEVTKKDTLEQIYSRIEQELRNQYSLGYTSDSTAGSGYRKLKIVAKQSGLVVQARQGYFADAKT